MTKILVKPTNTAVFSTLIEHLNAQESADCMMKLIQNPQFEFRLPHDAESLKNFEERGFIRCHRSTPKSPRLFSLVNALGFYFSVFMRSNNFSYKEIGQINEALNDRGERGISDWASLVYIGAALLSDVEVFLKVARCEAEGDLGVEIELVAGGTDDDDNKFHLSQALREQFFNGDGHLSLYGRSSSLLPHLLYQIDHLRSRLGWELLCPVAYGDICSLGEHMVPRLIDSHHVSVLNRFAPSLYNEQHDAIHRDAQGNLYGIQITPIQWEAKRTFESSKLISDMSQLNRVIAEK